jgi:hypothetical protein
MPRHRLDQYETPPHYVAPLLELIGPLDGLSVYEPCVGKGHISRFLMDAGHLCTNDIDDGCEATLHRDARKRDAWPPYDPGDDWQVDWTVTNPPFSDELVILQHAIVSSRNVAFLARLSFLEPTRSRGGFWLAHPPTDVIVLPRYSFRLNDVGKRQTDNVTCCWIVYRERQAPCLRFVAPGGRGGTNHE